MCHLNFRCTSSWFRKRMRFSAFDVAPSAEVRSWGPVSRQRM
jgi:hypothetical protein